MKSVMTFTPGPWSASCAPFDMAVTAVRNGRRVDILAARSVGACGPEDESNINLAAAAPDMLAALELYDSMMTDSWRSPDCLSEEHVDALKLWPAVQSAIAKAKGEA